MNELQQFIENLKNIDSNELGFSIEKSRKIVSEINKFLFTTNSTLGEIEALGEKYPYFSAFHKYWEHNYKEILDLKINEENCKKVAKILHEIYVKTNGTIFYGTANYNDYNLSPEEICRIRLLTANQDFNGSRDFKELVDIYNDDNNIFDVEAINENPGMFLDYINVTDLSQNDKRKKYAKKITDFIIENNAQKNPYIIIDCFNRDVYKFKEALISYEGAGYGNKKTDMFIRDMVVSGVWNDVYGFDSINVASDVNTIKIALHTGILNSAIPLVSSFLDIFCYQYGYVENTSALAWRNVWKMWNETYPEDRILSPCLLDYFIYNVVGRQFCKNILCTYVCDNNHTFFEKSRLKKCPICNNDGQKNVNVTKINSELPCMNIDGSKALMNTNFFKYENFYNLPCKCPFEELCKSIDKKYLAPPKSISILGQTGWTSAYSEEKEGGGGLMS